MPPPPNASRAAPVEDLRKTGSHKNRNEKLGKVTEAGDYTFNNECIAQEKPPGVGGGESVLPPPGQE